MPTPTTLRWTVVGSQGPTDAGAPQASSPAEALAATPEVPWPISVVSDDGRRLGLDQALGSGGAEIEHLLATLRDGGSDLGPEEVAAKAAASPGGRIDLRLDQVTRAEGVRRASMVERSWLEEVDRRRVAPRAALIAAGREMECEAALHVAMLMATVALDPLDDTNLDAHIVSGAQLWLLAGAVVWSLADAGTNPFGPWAELVASGHWPVGPCQGRLVLCPGVGSR